MAGRSGVAPRRRSDRVRTRRTFVSTAPTGRPKAIAATARAVYGPTPGQAIERLDVVRDPAAVLVADDLRGAAGG